MTVQHGSFGGTPDNPIGRAGAPRLAPIQLDGMDGGESGTSTPKKYDVTWMPVDYTLGELYDMWRKNAITMPEFRREYVWTPVQASRLIESFMMDLPVPPVFMMMDAEDNALVVDGMHRLLTVFYFFDGRYGGGVCQKPTQEFRIVGINKNNEICGKRFNDLPDYIQKELKGQLLRSILIRRNPPENGDIDGTVAYHMFERLNASRTGMSEQEIRNSVYSGRLNDLIHDLNGGKDWRKVLGNPRPDPHMHDLQLVLRCMALAHRWNAYRGPMKDFLSNFMHDMRNPPDYFIQRKKELFGDVCRSMIDHLGERPFHNQHGALNVPLLDAVFVAFARSAGDVPSDMKERFEGLKGDAVFAPDSDASAAGAPAVKRRIEITSKILFG